MTEIETIFQGFVLIHRKMVETSFWTKPNIAHLATHLIITASHKDKKMIWKKHEVTLKRGERIAGRNSLSKETGLTPKETRNGLEVLENIGFITRKRANTFSIITIVKYNQFQDKPIEYGPARGQRRASQGPQSNKDNNDNNGITNVIPAPKRFIENGNGNGKPNFIKFVMKFKESYEAMTGAPFKAEQRHYVISKKLIDKYGYEKVAEKAKWLGVICQDQSSWFAKDGWASFTIEKLSAMWNNILPRDIMSQERKEKRDLEEAKLKTRLRHEQLNKMLNK